jgi:signal transduction histidine kinase
VSPTSASVEQLAKLLTSTPDGLLVVDTDGIVRYANPAAHALFQRAPGGLVGEPFGLPHVAGVRDIDLVLTDGSLRTVEMRAVPTTWSGSDMWVLALRDATEVRRREKELEASLLASTDLTNELTHELSTPLAVIIGFADTLESHWDDLDDPQRRDLLHRLGVQARRLHHMIRRMLLVDSTLEAGQPEPVELWEVALSHLPDLAVPSVQIDCPRDLRVMAEPAHVDEIVVNLVENASKYGVPPITVRARRHGDVVELSVCDHGPGVPDEFVPRLFERYSRAEETARRQSGSGLGLYLVEKLARASGGHVSYRNNEPHGACFVVTLPAA